jgi:hypothetical protein
MIVEIVLTLLIILFFTLFGVYLSKSTDCDQKYQGLQKKYEDDTKPLKFQVQDMQTQIFEGTKDKDKLQLELDSRGKRISVLERNVLGKFDKSYLISDKEKSCVTIADNTKGDYSYLQLNTQCKEPEVVDIFTFDPVYKQLSVKLGGGSKCVDSINETDVVINDCIKTSQKQKFNYFPLYDGRFKSLLYNKCLGYNADTNLIELQKCGDANNVHTAKTVQQSHLFLENVPIS